MPARLHLVAVLLAGLLLGACEPIRNGTLLGQNGAPPASPASPGQTPDAGVQTPDAGVQTPDAGVQTPDAGVQTPDAASIQCWNKRQLATNVENMVFTFDAQGLGHYAYNRGSKVYLGSTRPGDVPTPIDALEGSVRGIAVDSQGQRHLILYSYLASYAREQEGSWQQFELPPVIEMPPVSSPGKLRLDASGFAHMIDTRSEYHDSGSTYHHTYVTNQSGSWVFTKLDFVPPESTITALELDARGHAHIAYLDYDTGKGSHYATNASGVWVSEVVTKAIITNRALELALDAEGRPHLLYVSSRQSYYATKREGMWQFLLGGTAGGIISLKVDAAGNLHSLLDLMEEREIAYAILPAGGRQWSFAPPLSLEWQGQQMFLWEMVLGLNAAGEVRIGYWGSAGYPNTNHMYAEQCPRNGLIPRQ